MALLSLSPRCCKFGVAIPFRPICLQTRDIKTRSSPPKSAARKKKKQAPPTPKKVVLGEAWARRLVLYHGDLPNNLETISVFHALKGYNPFFLLPESKYVDPWIRKENSRVKPYNFVLETVAFPTRDDVQTICEYTGEPFISLVHKTGAFATHSLDAFLDQFCREPEKTKLPFMVDHLQKEVIFSGTRIAQWVHQEILAAGKREAESLERLRIALKKALHTGSLAENLTQEVNFREKRWEEVYKPYDQLRKARLKMTVEKRKRNQELATFTVRR